MKLGGTSCIAMKYHKTVWGTQQGFYMKITESNSKEMQKDMLYMYIKRKIEFERENVETKLLIQEQLLTVEMGIQRKSELVDTSCKSNEVSQNGLGDTTCFLRRSFQIPEQPTVKKLFQVIRKHKRN